MVDQVDPMRKGTQQPLLHLWNLWRGGLFTSLALLDVVRSHLDQLWNPFVHPIVSKASPLEQKGGKKGEGNGPTRSEVEMQSLLKTNSQRKKLGD